MISPAAALLTMWIGAAITQNWLSYLLQEIIKMKNSGLPIQPPALCGKYLKKLFPRNMNQARVLLTGNTFPEQKRSSGIPNATTGGTYIYMMPLPARLKTKLQKVIG